MEFSDDGAACAEVSRVATEAAGRRQQEDGERRPCSKMVQNIALCEKLGIKYSTKGAACAPRRQKRLKKPSARVAPAAQAMVPISAPDPFSTEYGAPGETSLEQAPELLGEMAAENASFLAEHGCWELVLKRRGRSAINADVGSVPHDAAAYLDYLRPVGAPAVCRQCHCPGNARGAAEAVADKGPHPSALAQKEFLWGEAFEMSAATKIKGARVSPPGVIPQRDRRARTISNPSG